MKCGAERSGDMACDWQEGKNLAGAKASIEGQKWPNGRVGGTGDAVPDASYIL
jgi:hypothetical protein